MAFQMQIMGNRKNAYARLTKAKKTKVAKTRWVVATTWAIDVATQYLGSFILALLDDLFFTQI
jgi:hypothetical protein